MWRLVLASIASFWLIAAAFPQEQAPKSPRFTPAADWEWLVEPVVVKWSAMASQTMLFRMDQRANGEFVVSVAYLDASLDGIAKYQPVAFDAQGGRHEFGRESWVSAGGQSMVGFSVKGADLAGGKIEYFGVEKMTVATFQEVIAPKALSTLKDAGLEALSYPIQGQRYEFELTALDGRKIKSSDLLGKVVLFDFWAGWCNPCVGAFPVLKRTYGELHEKGLEIVGINMDYTRDDAVRLVAEHGLAWPNAIAPTEDDKRALWEQAAGVGSIPRYVVLDRRGVVKADLSGYDPEKLSAELGALIGK